MTKTWPWSSWVYSRGFGSYYASPTWWLCEKYFLGVTFSELFGDYELHCHLVLSKVFLNVHAYLERWSDFDLSQIWSKRNRRNTVWGFVCDFGPQKQKPWNAHHVSKRAFCCLGLYRGWNPTLLYRHYYIVNHNKDPYETTRIYFLPPSSAGGFAVSWLQDMVFSQIGWTGVFGNPWGLKHKGFGTTWVFSIQRDRLPWKSLATIFV